MKDANVDGNFNRLSLKRNDTSWIAKELLDKNSRFLLYRDNCFLTTTDSAVAFLDESMATSYSKSDIEWKFLGQKPQSEEADCKKISVFGASINDSNEKADNANWQSLRRIALQLSAADVNLLFFAQGLFNWHSSHHFCNHCGNKLIQAQSGHALKCSSKDCAKEIFPRTDPAIIVLVYFNDSCLLGRQAHWPEHMYSCLAGFIETGETIEDAVVREVYEESGIRIKRVEYLGSQPWPFPQSLMLGFHAEASNQDLTFHDKEIEDARWYSRKELIAAVENKELRLSTPVSISYRLLENWFNLDSDRPLASYLNNE